MRETSIYRETLRNMVFEALAEIISEKFNLYTFIPNYQWADEAKIFRRIEPPELKFFNLSRGRKQELSKPKEEVEFVEFEIFDPEVWKTLKELKSSLGFDPNYYRVDSEDVIIPVSICRLNLGDGRFYYNLPLFTKWMRLKDLEKKREITNTQAQLELEEIERLKGRYGVLIKKAQEEEKGDD